MLRNDDRIARPSHGRTFPASPAEIARLIRDLGFAPPLYRRRLDIILRNADAPDQFGAQVAAFQPRLALVELSTSGDVDRGHAKALLERACREFAEIDKRSRASVGHETIVTYRAYLDPPNRLVITKRIRRARLAKYRGDAKFSNAFKAKGVKTDERILHSVEVT